MAWTALGFGEHKGKTLPHVVLSDPDYFFWAHSKNIFRGAVAAEAGRVAERATRIRIPDAKGERRVAVYHLHRPTGTFGGLRLGPESEALNDEEDAFIPMRNDVIDLSVPRQMKVYDKSGGRLLIRAVKVYLFGSAKARLTAKRCEAFFDHDGNFLLD